MSEIVEFLRARLSEDEQAARSAATLDGCDWTPFGLGADDFDRVEGASVTAVGYDMADASARHIARHDPARVLREVEAKRSIVDDHMDDEGQCQRCLDSDGIWEEDGKVIAYTQPYPCQTVRALAAAYSDHPDYREDWRP